MTVQAKYIYLARRHPLLDLGGFTERWRRHGALGMSMPRWANVRRYVQCDILAEAAPIPGICNGYDGVGMIWYHSLTARTSHTTDHASQAAMEADEAETFDEPVVNFGVLCAEEVARDLPGSGLKLIRFIIRPKPVSVSEFDAAWDQHTKAVLKFAEATGGLGRYVYNRTLPAERPEGWGLGVHGVEELWFNDMDALKRWHSAIHAALDSAASEAPWAGTISVVTKEAVLYDKPSA